MSGTYNLWVVTLSIAVAIFASYTGIDVAARVTATGRRARKVWLVGRALAMGVGIWLTHFVGMVETRMQGDATYDPIPVTCWIIAIVASLAVLRLAFRLRRAATSAGSWPKEALRYKRLSAEIATSPYRLAQGVSPTFKSAPVIPRRALGRHAGREGSPVERVGISSMRERVALLGGGSKTMSQPGTGTSLVAVVRLQTPEANGHRA